jgi:hypothetical protein
LKAFEIIAGDAPVGDMLAVTAECRVLPGEADPGQSLRLGHDLVGWKWMEQPIPPEYPARAGMPDNLNLLAARKPLQRDGADAVVVLGAQIVCTKVDYSVIADIDAVVGKARSARHQVIAVLEPGLVCHVRSFSSSSFQQA